jgi:hypothetical protein
VKRLEKLNEPSIYFQSKFDDEITLEPLFLLYTSLVFVLEVRGLKETFVVLCGPFPMIYYALHDIENNIINIKLKKVHK